MTKGERDRDIEMRRYGEERAASSYKGGQYPVDRCTCEQARGMASSERERERERKINKTEGDR